jgi:hypothetical protein
MINWNQLLVESVLIAELWFTGNTVPQKSLLTPTFKSSLAPESQLTSKRLPSIQKSRVTQGSQWSLCGRSPDNSKRVSGFTGDTSGTYISYIQVDIHSNTYSTVTLKWKNINSSTENLPLRFSASPGAGRCGLDCRSIADSQKPGSRCTPLSPPLYSVQGYDCVLSHYPEAKFVTWFYWDRAIAFHSYSLLPYPASHGCIRLATKKRYAEWIYDNSLAGITQIKISWDKSEGLGEKCWDGETQISRPKE